MPIIFSVVSRGIIVLAKHATCAGNFDDVMEYILAKIPLQNDALTYSQGPYLFHYIRENGITYMCITDDAFQRSRAFLFLLEIKTRFRGAYGNGVLTALPYVINTEFSLVLAKEMQSYSTSDNIDTLTELDELKEIMAKNVDSTCMNEDRVQLLVNNADGHRVGYSAIVITQEQARSMFKKSIIFWSFIIAMHVLSVGTEYWANAVCKHHAVVIITTFFQRWPYVAASTCTNGTCTATDIVSMLPRLSKCT